MSHHPFTPTLALKLLLLLLPTFQSRLLSAAEWSEPCALHWLVDSPPGARETALGEAGTALAEGPPAAWWNPAGLAGLLAREVVFESVAIHHMRVDKPPVRCELAIAWPIGARCGAALRMDRMDWGDPGRYDGPWPLALIQGERSCDQVIGLSAGFAATKTLSLGATAEWIHSLVEKPNMHMGEAECSGSISDSPAFDLGLRWQPASATPIHVGLVLAELGPQRRLSDYFDPGILDHGTAPLPTHLRLGLAAMPLRVAGTELTLTGELTKGLVHQFLDSVVRVTLDGQPAYWDESGFLTTDPTDDQGHARAPAFRTKYDHDPSLLAVFSDWFRQGPREELHLATYHLGAELTRSFDLPQVGGCRLALRGGRIVDASSGRRSWSWGLGWEAWRLSLDFSQESQGLIGGSRRLGYHDRTQRLSVGLVL